MLNSARFGRGFQRLLPWAVLTWGLLLAGWLARVYFELPADRVHVNHERHHYALRLLEFRDLLGAGYLFPQWATHFRAGFGSPYFGYYQPGVFYAASLVPWAVSANRALGLTVMAFALLGYGAMWLLVRRYWGAVSATVAASLLPLAVYSGTEIYIRGDLAEFAAMMCIAPALLALDSWFRDGRLRAAGGLALAGAAITVTHASVGLIVHLALGCGLVVCLLRAETRGRAFGAGIALTFGVGLAAFYWVPLLFEWQFVAPDEAFTGFYNYANNFVTPSQLIDSYHRETLVPLTLGRLALALALINTVLAWRVGPRSQRWYFVSGWLLLGGSAWLMSSASTLVWAKFGPLQRLQFPWRVQTLSTVVLAALAGAIPTVPWKGLHLGWGACVIAAALWLSRDYTAYEVHSGLRVPSTAAALTDSFVAPDLRDEWMPKGANVEAARKRVHLEASTTVAVSDYRLKQGRLEFRVDSDAGGTIRLPHYYFPVGWHARCGDQALNLNADRLGLMQLEVPSGLHGNVEVSFSATPMRRHGLLVSGLTLIVAIAIGASVQRSRLRRGSLTHTSSASV